MSYAVRQIHDLRLVVFAEAGPLLKDENDVSLFIAPAFEHDAGMIALPVTASTPPSSNSEAAWRPRHIAEIHQLPPARGAAGRYPPPGRRKATRCKISCVKPTAANRSGSSLLSPNSNSGLVPDRKGSSRFTGKCCFDFQEEVSVIPKTIGHSLHHFYLIVHPFQYSDMITLPHFDISRRCSCMQNHSSQGITPFLNKNHPVRFIVTTGVTYPDIGP